MDFKVPVPLTIADRVLIGVSACLVAASFVLARPTGGGGTIALVQVDGRTVYKLRLDETHRVVVQGTSGLLTVETKDGEVAVTDAGCPNRLCVRTGWRSRAGDVIVCVPNKTVVRILPGGEDSVRAITG